MAATEQSASSHARFLPLYHFVTAPLLVLYFIVSVSAFVRSPSEVTLVGSLAAFAIALGIGLARAQALTAQDRIIRLEETLRLQRLLPQEAHGEIALLDRKEFIALRFASDAELPELFRRVRAGELGSQKEIKMAIRHWRPDHLRV
ncbi:MAG: DUF6526 family protein [Gemmatimonadaceae bacterium]